MGCHSSEAWNIKNPHHLHQEAAIHHLASADVDAGAVQPDREGRRSAARHRDVVLGPADDQAAAVVCQAEWG